MQITVIRIKLPIVLPLMSLSLAASTSPDRPRARGCRRAINAGGGASAADHSLAVSLLSRLAHRAGLVTVRQTFVRRSHGGNRPCPGGSMMRNGTSSALKSEQDLASILMAGGGLSRLAIARLKSAGVPVAPLL